MPSETRRTFLKTMGAAALSTTLPLPAGAQRVKP